MTTSNNLTENSTFQEIINVLNSIPVNPKAGATGNAQPNQVVNGVTFSNIDSIDLVGTMPNRGAVTNTITAQNGQYAIPEGYHNGTGKVTATIPNLTAGNLKYKVNSGGVVGNLIGYLPKTATCGFMESAEIKINQNVNSYNMGADKIITGFGINFSGSNYYACVGYGAGVYSNNMGTKGTMYFSHGVTTTSSNLHSINFGNSFYRESGTPMYIAPNISISDDGVMSFTWINNGSWSRFDGGAWLYYTYILK